MSELVQGERDGGLVIEFRCPDCDRSEKFTLLGWTGDERVYAAVCEECEAPVAAAVR